MLTWDFIVYIMTCMMKKIGPWHFYNENTNCARAGLSSKMIPRIFVLSSYIISSVTVESYIVHTCTLIIFASLELDLTLYYITYSL